MDAGEDEIWMARKAEPLVAALTIFNDFLTKLETIEANLRPDPSNQASPGLSIIQSGIVGQAYQTSIQNAPSSSPQTVSPGQITSSAIKMIPLH
ncbi:hypothetical protein JTB14_036604 [Gonioctena quinquepunctata]|nr:hypothetical protein JTB14_036604 [Gonioctena quinquepunctata]